jgi:hypothetical protein
MTRNPLRRTFVSTAALTTWLASAACGADPAGSGDTADATSSGGADSSGVATTESTGAPPVTCGAPGDEASTDAEIAALEGCEVYLGSVTLLAGASSVAPLMSLRVLEGELFLGGTNSPLTTLEGLEQLEAVGDLTLNSHNLANLLPLRGLTEVNGDFTMLSMFNLVDLRGLESLRLVEGNLELLANPMLMSVDGLEGLEEVRGDFEATSYMTPLPRAAVQALVDRIQIGGMVNID